MRFVPRSLEKLLSAAAQAFPAVVLTGPRQVGKTTLLRRLFSEARYVLLEDPDIQARSRADPRGFLDELRPPVIFDEIQHVPDLLAYVRTKIDRQPRKHGQWIFTGSQEAPLMRGITESMAGRAAILQLLPFSVMENERVSMLGGGFPEALARPKTRTLWFSSYVQTYLERDVRSITNVRDVATFRRFLALVAARHGQLLNKTDLAAPLGVSVPTVGEWLNVLELTGQIILVPPYFENFGKRLVKSPKVYIGDSGLACHLLGIHSSSELGRSPFLGSIFEGFVASEILKSQVNAGERKQLYHFRDQQGLEVDFLVPAAGGELWMIECKAGRTVSPAMINSVLALRRATGSKDRKSVLVYRPSPDAPSTRVIAPGAEAIDVRALVEKMSTAEKPRRLPRAPRAPATSPKSVL
jgi:predicted AAA+ superfamily ATPase